jgi:hypothetical protein
MPRRAYNAQQAALTPEQKSYVVGRIRAISLEIDDDLIDFDGLEASDGNIQTLLDEKSASSGS